MKLIGRILLDIDRGNFAATLGGGATATLAALVLFSALLSGQIETGTIAGQVKDASGAAMAGVKVEASQSRVNRKV